MRCPGAWRAAPLCDEDNPKHHTGVVEAGVVSRKPWLLMAPEEREMERSTGLVRTRSSQNEILSWDWER